MPSNQLIEGDVHAIMSKFSKMEFIVEQLQTTVNNSTAAIADIAATVHSQRVQGPLAVHSNLTYSQCGLNRSLLALARATISSMIGMWQAVGDCLSARTSVDACVLTAVTLEVLAVCPTACC